MAFAAAGAALTPSCAAPLGGAPLAPAGKLAFDASSRAVRIAALRSLRGLLDCPHAQPVLKVGTLGIAWDV
jgi:hypothetical protein